MTEKEWVEAKSIIDLDLYRSAKGQHRKWRLFAVACCRRAMELVKDARLEPVVEAAERFADGEYAWDEVKQARKVFTAIRKEIGDPFGPKESLNNTLDALEHATGKTPVAALGADEKCSYAFAAQHRNSKKHKAWDQAMAIEEQQQLRLARCVFGNPFRPVAFAPAWRSESAVALARTAYDTRNFSLLPILADALEEAGCDNADILSHCREPNGVHARGCWAVDLVRNKS